MTITITTSNVNGIRAAKRKGIEEWAGRNTPDVWCMQEVRAPQNEIDPIFDEFGFEYSTAGRISDQSELHRMNEICRIKGRAGVGLCRHCRLSTNDMDCRDLRMTSIPAVGSKRTCKLHKAMSLPWFACMCMREIPMIRKK